MGWKAICDYIRDSPKQDPPWKSDSQGLSFGSEEGLYAVLQAAPVGMLVFDEEQKLLFSNTYAEEMFGKKHRELRGLRCAVSRRRCIIE
jgi:PAS domain-containing protein